MYCTATDCNDLWVCVVYMVGLRVGIEKNYPRSSWGSGAVASSGLYTPKMKVQWLLISNYLKWSQDKKHMYQKLLLNYCMSKNILPNSDCNSYLNFSLFLNCKYFDEQLQVMLTV